MAKSKGRELTREQVARLETLQQIEERQSDFRGKLIIDKNELDEQMEEMADLFFRVGEDHEIALSIRDDLKADMERTYAEVSSEYRENPGEDVKVTEGWIKEKTQQDERYLLAVSDYNQARRVAGLASVMKESMEQRSNMLKHLGNLYGSGYFVTTTVEGSKSRTRDANAEAGRSALAEQRASRPPLGRKKA